MPYTPPAAKSPAASRPDTPCLSRSQSYNESQHEESGSAKNDSQNHVRHASSSRAYLNKHRRSPSIAKTPSSTTGQFTPDAMSTENSFEGGEALDCQGASGDRHQNLNSPRSPTDPSPSVSPQTSSDEENTTRRGRSRDVTNLAELQAAIRIIEQHRAGSPNRQERVDTKEARKTLRLPVPRLGLTTTGDVTQPDLLSHPPLSAGARKISHSRSTTNATAFFDFPRHKFDSPTPSSSQSDDEDIEDDDLRMKPALIRKKSGELVRPALRASSMKRRPSSMPGTPTYSKAVRFQDNSLEHVRHFLQVDRPIAVSAGTSPVDPYDDELEFPFSGDGSGSRAPQYDWAIKLTNFPRDTFERQAIPVRTERVYLSSDTRVLIGSVAVQNLAFHKLVVARFTVDFWKTTSEVVAEFSNDVRKEQVNDGCDRFTFNIQLEDQANLETKTMFFCVKYHVNGQDYWDNNNAVNYQIDFSKKPKSLNGKQVTQAKKSLNPSPRNKSSISSSPRPRSMPSFDDFANMVSPYEFSSFPQPSAMVGDSPIRFKTKQPAKDIIPDAPGRSKASANQQAFGNRYDFGASLSAAIQGTGPKEEIKPSSSKVENEAPLEIKIQPSPDAGKPVDGNEPIQSDVRGAPKPAALTSEKPSLSSSSYHELLDKYCFFGSAKPSSQVIKSNPSQLDGTADTSSGPPKTPAEISETDCPSLPQTSLAADEGKKPSPQTATPRASRSVSPAIGPVIGSRTGSPAFGYPYHQPMQAAFFETHTPTAILG